MQMALMRWAISFGIQWNENKRNEKKMYTSIHGVFVRTVMTANMYQIANKTSGSYNASTVGIGRETNSKV